MSLTGPLGNVVNAFIDSESGVTRQGRHEPETFSISTAFDLQQPRYTPVLATGDNALKYTHANERDLLEYFRVQFQGVSLNVTNEVSRSGVKDRVCENVLNSNMEEIFIIGRCKK